MSYATLAEFIAWTGGDPEDTSDDLLIQLSLDAATAAVDEQCFRTFTPAASATARTYRVQAGQTELSVDDHVGTATVTVNGSAVTVEAVPVSPGRPFNSLHGSFHTTSLQVEVTAEWGWPAVPQAVKSATLLLAAKLDQRRQSPNGIEKGSAEAGFIRILGVDKDVETLLKPYVRLARSFS